MNTMAVCENIYFSVNPVLDGIGYHQFFKDNLLENMEKFRLESLSSSEVVFMFNELEVLPSGIQRYPFGFSVKDKVRIYFASNWTDNYPVYIILSAQFMQLNDIRYCIDYSYSVLNSIFNFLSPGINVLDYDFKLSRFDIANHNNFINLKHYIKINEYNKRVVTRIRKVFPVVDLNGQFDQEVPYFRYGKGDLVIRFYNKIKEVCEQQYKSFFFLRWKEEGLIDERTFNVYEYVYKLNFNYRVDFLLANIIYSNVSDFVILDVTRIYNDASIDIVDKYDILSSYIKEYKIVLCEEIVNVEFQCRGTFLKTVRIVDKETGEIIDFLKIQNLIKHMNELYRYLTSECFRVVVRNNDVKRKRDRAVDSSWRKIQGSIVKNIVDMNLNCKFYKEYNEKMDSLISVRDSLNKLVHSYYVNSDCLTKSDIDNISINDLFENIKREYDMNENYFNIKNKFEKQIKYYGEKFSKE